MDYSGRSAKPEKLPKGIKEGRGIPSTSSLRVQGIGSFASGTQHYQNTYEVQQKHEKLAGNKTGVKFNVETVPAPEKEHIQKPKIEQDEYVASLRDNAWDAYRDFADGTATKEQTRIERASTHPNNLVHAGGQGFFAACLCAFAQHLPLALSPDHIWAVIAFAFAQHVDKHAEELRRNFVKHEGKKRLEVSADHMIMGGGDPTSGSPPEIWESTIFPSFSNQIKEHIGEDVHATIVGDFTTTSAVTRAANEITLMSAMKHYFSYGMLTKCGIPNITLSGTEEDWVSLRAQAEALGKLMTPKFKRFWMPKLLPVLDEFIESYRGNVNHGFWQSMVKLRYRGGSGACSKISGWIQIFFPYLKSGRLNENLRPWDEMYFIGPDPNEIPPIVSSAPVDWEYFGTTYDLHFFAGFTGCSQDEDGTLTPEMGWYVAHDPPKDPDSRLVTIKEEVEALMKGHKDEIQSGDFDKTQPWNRRVSVLLLEYRAVKAALLETLTKKQHSITQRQRWCNKDELQELEKESGIIEGRLNVLKSNDVLF